MGAENPPATNLRPTGTSGVCSFVCEGYVEKVAASGAFWLVRSDAFPGVMGGVGVIVEGGFGGEVQPGRKINPVIMATVISICNR